MNNQGQDGDFLDLNAAGADALIRHAGISRERVRELLRGRPFRGWADVEKLYGFDRETVEELKRNGVVIGSPTDAEPATG